MNEQRDVATIFGEFNKIKNGISEIPVLDDPSVISQLSAFTENDLFKLLGLTQVTNKNLK